ncbi:hypothetical protein IWX46DRAFT_203998 [Phyllosticta citricarpa]|uniref:Uncharacterized protein n=1 Tax=Phyllosticta citricarpa TaxID=55181 RepID=A0ABR1LVG4_9PEZI
MPIRTTTSTRILPPARSLARGSSRIFSATRPPRPTTLHLEHRNAPLLALSTPPSSSSSSFSNAARFFSSSPIPMAAQKIDGNAIAKSIREKLNAEIHEKQQLNPRYKPALRIIQGTSPMLMCSAIR